MWNKGAGFDAGLAPDAFFLVNHSNIAVFGADMGRARRAILHTERIGTLPTYMYQNVKGVFIENGPVHLNSGQGKINSPIMS